MKKFIIPISIGLVLLSSCSRNTVRNTQADDFIDRCSVVKTGEKIFPVDDNTSTNFDYLQYIHNDTLPMLSLLNTYSNSIYLYDAEKYIILDTITFDKEGAHGVGKIQGYYYHNDDSIFTYAYGYGRVFLANRKGKVVQKYNLFDPDELMNDTTQFRALPYFYSWTPMLYKDDRLILTGGFFTETSLEKSDNTFVTNIYDVVKGKGVYTNSYPEQYQKYEWDGGFFYRQPSISLYSDSSFLLGFSADHRLRHYDWKTGEQTYFYAGSKDIKDIEPLRTNKVFVAEHPNDEIRDWYYSQPSYEGVFADPYKHLVYRIARLPNPTQKKGTFNAKPVIIIVLDEQLNYIGEELLPEGLSYDTFNSYVSPEGLHIHIRNPKDEDHLTFYTYNMKR